MDRLPEAMEDKSEGGSDDGSSGSGVGGFRMTDLASTYLCCALTKLRCPISDGRGQQTKLLLTMEDGRCQRLWK